MVGRREAYRAPKNGFGAVSRRSPPGRSGASAGASGVRVHDAAKIRKPTYTAQIQIRNAKMTSMTRITVPVLG